MLTKTLVSCTLFFCAINMQAQPPADSAAIAHTLVSLEQKLADALPGDSVTWSRYLDPQFYIVDENGDVASRAEFLSKFEPFPKDITGKVLVTRPVLSV